MNPEALDDLLAQYDRDWGPDRLPRLVRRETQERWAKLSAIWRGDVPTTQTPEAVRAAVARAYAAMAEEAVAQGHRPIPPPVAEAEWEPGKVFAVALDAHHKQALELRAKADGRDHYSVWTVAELAVLIRSIPIVSTIKDMFPGADILPPRLPPVGRVPRDDLGPVLEPQQEMPA